MLINLSNHPSDKWGAAQCRAAQERFGSIYDLPFPAIAADAGEAYVTALAQEYGARCDRLFLANADQTPDDEILDTHDGVHLMGETAFVVEFALYWRSGAIREPLYCSTTERNVEELPDGSKRTIFRFVQFRAMAVR